MDEIKWCDPPKKASSGRESKWKKLLRPLTEQPGRSAMIASRPTPSAASALAYYLRSGKAGLEGEWEFTARGDSVWAKFKKGRTITEISQGEVVAEAV